MKGVWACCKAEGSEDERSQGLLQARNKKGSERRRSLLQERRKVEMKVVRANYERKKSGSERSLGLLQDGKNVAVK
jgi:hypothetical protein